MVQNQNPKATQVEESTPAFSFGSNLKLLNMTTSTGIPAFPWRLHDMLEDAETKGFSNIVAWQEDGSGFKVFESKAFVEDIMPAYFNQTQYKSFQRQLNIYGFQRVTRGKEKGSYTHDLFTRGKPALCRFMTRTKIKGKGSKDQLSSQQQEPVPLSSIVMQRRTASCPDGLSMDTLRHQQGSDDIATEMIPSSSIKHASSSIKHGSGGKVSIEQSLKRSFLRRRASLGFRTPELNQMKRHNATWKLAKPVMITNRQEEEEYSGLHPNPLIEEDAYLKLVTASQGDRDRPNLTHLFPRQPPSIFPFETSGLETKESDNITADVTDEIINLFGQAQRDHTSSLVEERAGRMTDEEQEHSDDLDKSLWGDLDPIGLIVDLEQMLH
jgi:hypothetical protein